MKKYTIKNYKGNIVESLSKFKKSHKGMKIIEACEEKEELKIKAEESEKIEEGSVNFALDIYNEPNDFAHNYGLGKTIKKYNVVNMNNPKDIDGADQVSATPKELIKVLSDIILKNPKLNKKQVYYSDDNTLLDIDTIFVTDNGIVLRTNYA